MPAYRNNNGSPEEMDVHLNQGGAGRCKVYENQGGTPVLLYSPTVLDDVVYVLEEWDPGTFDQWGDVAHNPQISSDYAFSKTYSLMGPAGGANSNVKDNERDHNNLPRYMQRGDNMRVMIYHPDSYTQMNDFTAFRWAYGGPYEEAAYYVQADLFNDAFHIIDSTEGEEHTTLVSDYGYNYPGGEWWAMEIEWRNPTHTARLVDYSDPDNPVVQSEIQVDSTKHDDSYPLGHAWYVWNRGTTNAMYSDYAVFYE